MKVVALLSGGKDSCYSVVQCLALGHEVVAFANLQPESGKHELDSFMYQTVGHEAVALIAQAAELPLVRRQIQGRSTVVSMEYSVCADDEVEDLLELLSDVKRHFPQVEAVCSGAILSDYQRIRVEHVCKRLGLISLAWLWQRNQHELLNEMITAEMNSVLIKVAAAGLVPSRHLGKSLAEMQQTLVKLNQMYEVHECGEGGEYETFTTDAPFFTQRIILGERNIVSESDDTVCPVAHLLIHAATVEAKSASERTHDAEVLAHTTRLIRADAHVTGFIEECVEQWNGKERVQGENAVGAATATHSTEEPQEPFVLSCVRNASSSLALSVAVSSVEHLSSAFSALSDCLAREHITCEQVLLVHLYVTDMSLFAHINGLYASVFHSSPPARVCVALQSDSPCAIQLDLIARPCASSSDGSSIALPLRRSLYVQSRSHWAPANIGPYSQAITIGTRVYFSGQIGLIPATMEFPQCNESVFVEGLLALRHCARVRDVVASKLPRMPVVTLCLCFVTSESDIEIAKECIKESNEWENGQTTAVVFASVAGLPRGAQVEWHMVMECERKVESDNDDSDDGDGGVSGGGFGVVRALPAWVREEVCVALSPVVLVVEQCGAHCLSVTSMDPITLDMCGSLLLERLWDCVRRLQTQLMDDCVHMRLLCRVDAGHAHLATQAARALSKQHCLCVPVAVSALSTPTQLAVVILDNAIPVD